VLGAAPSIAAGEYIQASGTWENHREHGLQFRATFLRVTAPTSAEGMEKYLGSVLIKGIGPTFAQRLVGAFSEAVFEVIEQAPQRLLARASLVDLGVRDFAPSTRPSRRERIPRTEDSLAEGVEFELSGDFLYG
jgi:exodeoxyribonuclease V alpha subunit